MYKNIIPKEAKKRFDEEENIILLDVRTKEEYDEIHIPGSTLIPLDKLEIEVQNKLPDKQTTIFTFCRSGGRVLSALKILKNFGYENVYNLGGIMHWPYETVKK